jgi:hypothetical protein
MAGATRLPLVRFLGFDALGAMFWSMTYAAVGYIFSNQLDRVAPHAVGLGTVVVLAVAAGLGFHLVRNFVRWQRFVSQFKLALTTRLQLRDDAVELASARVALPVRQKGSSMFVDVNVDIEKEE